MDLSNENKPETFGQRVKRLRERMGVNRAELARLANMTRTAVGMYEERDTADKCQVQHLRRLAVVMSTSMDYLIDGTERAGAIDTQVLQRGIEFSNDIIRDRNPEKMAKLIKFAYGLESQGVTPTKEIVRGFYQAL